MTRAAFGKIFPKLTVAFVCFAFAAQISFAQIKTDRFFPATTKGFIAISDIDLVHSQWEKTDFGKTISSPEFDPFRKECIKQIEEAWLSRFGMTMQDVTDIASGEIGIGLVADPGKKPGIGIIVDFSGKEDRMKSFLSKLVRKANDTPKGESHLEKVSTKKGEFEVTVLTFPPDEQSMETRTTYYTISGQYLVASDQKYLIEQLVNESLSPLAGDPIYQATMRRCIMDYPKMAEPMFRFYIVPISFGEAIRTLRSVRGQDQQKKTSPWKILAEQGFDGIQGIGGIMDIGTEGYESIFRAKAYIPNTPTKALSMLKFIDSGAIQVPDWVSYETNRCSLLNMDMLQLFNNMGPLFNAFLETPDVWEDTLKSLEKDEKGPKVNLKTELIANLGSQISVMRRFENWKENVVIGIRIKDGQAPKISSALHRMFDTDPEFTVEPFENDSIWIRNSQQPQQPQGRRSGSRTAKRPNQRVIDQENAQKIEVQYCFYVANDTLFISNDPARLKELIQMRKAGKIVSLETSQDFQRVNAILTKLAGPNGCSFKIYAANKEGFRNNYELFRENRMNQGKTLFTFIAKNLLAGPNNSADGTILIDGSTLPPFSTLEGHIGSSGFFGQNETDGWFYKGISIQAK